MEKHAIDGVDNLLLLLVQYYCSNKFADNAGNDDIIQYKMYVFMFLHIFITRHRQYIIWFCLLLVLCDSKEDNKEVIIWCLRCRFQITVSITTLWNYFVKLQWIDFGLCVCHVLMKLARNTHWKRLVNFNILSFLFQIFLEYHIHQNTWRKNIKLECSLKCGCIKKNESLSNIVARLFR